MANSTAPSTAPHSPLSAAEVVDRHTGLARAEGMDTKTLVVGPEAGHQYPVAIDGYMSTRTANQCSGGDVAMCLPRLITPPNDCAPAPHGCSSCRPYGSGGRGNRD